MATAVEVSGFRRFHAKKANVQAKLHTGEPAQYPTATGMQTAIAGQYVVQVGTAKKRLHTPPSTDEKGKRVGSVDREVEEPLFEVMSAEDFEALYEPQGH